MICITAYYDMTAYNEVLERFGNRLKCFTEPGKLSENFIVVRFKKLVLEILMKGLWKVWKSFGK
jgi:hypothetical protein